MKFAKLRKFRLLRKNEERIEWVLLEGDGAKLKDMFVGYLTNAVAVFCKRRWEGGMLKDLQEIEKLIANAGNKLDSEQKLEELENRITICGENTEAR